MSQRLDDLRVQARYWRQKHDLYRAKTYGPRATSPARLRALARAAEAAEGSLRRAEMEARAQSDDG